MEDVLEIYHLPYDPNYPVVCMDESCKQMVGEARETIPCTPGRPVLRDDEYVRNRVAQIFVEVEPLGRRRHTIDAGSYREAQERRGGFDSRFSNEKDGFQRHRNHRLVAAPF